MQYKKFFVFVLVLAIIAVFIVIKTSADGRRAAATLDRADSLIAVGRADSAYALLDTVRTEFDAARRRYRMRYRLLEAEAMNKTYQDFETDSVMLEVVKYYDRHGSSNERLRARYMLGSAYRDMGDMPQAITTWEDAVEDADTLSPDCNYSVLARVYGQMADVYFRQYLFERQLDAQNHFCKNILLSGDTTNYIIGLIKRDDAYKHLGDTAAVWSNVEEVRDVCQRFGREDLFARVYSNPIGICIKLKEYDRAREMMQILERESGMFDEAGNIVMSGESFYYNKGCYYLAMGQLDSAEYQFRRLPVSNDFAVRAYDGLLKLYSIKKNIDSVLHYSHKYAEALDNFNRHTSTDAIVQAKGMYDYRRQQKIAEKRRKQAMTNGILALVSTSIGVIIILLLTVIYRRRQQRKEIELEQIRVSFNNTYDSLQKLQDEYKLLNDNHIEYLGRLRNEITAKKQEVKELQAKYELMSVHRGYSNLYKSQIVQIFRSKAKKYIIPTNTEWIKLDYEFSHTFSSFTSDIKSKLTPLEIKVCMLVVLDFNNAEISCLLNEMSSQAVSNTKARINSRLFDENGGDTVVLNIKSKLFRDV